MNRFLPAAVTLCGGGLGCIAGAEAAENLDGVDGLAAVIGGGIMGLTILALVLMVGRVVGMVFRSRSF
jgi:hypothetical protein